MNGANELAFPSFHAHNPLDRRTAIRHDAPRMNKSRLTRTMLSVALRLLLLALTVGLLELTARFSFAYLLPPAYAKVRSALAGKERFQPGYQNTTEQPYLLYIPTPNMPVDGQIDHNSQGYRGKAVSMDRTPGVYRILCLGGSTTYGWSVKRAAHTYPAQLENLLNQNPPPNGFQSVEVINAGAPYATSAEIFAAYHFKFHYYKPDLVIFNEGGNDAQTMIEPNYHPDFSNRRQAPIPIRPLPEFGRRVLKSRFLSLLIVPLVYGQNPSEPSFVRDARRPPEAVWYPRTTTRRYNDVMPPIPLAENAFAHNVKALIRAVKSDGAKLLLLPFREAPRADYPPGEIEMIAFNRKLLEEFAGRHTVGFAPFPLESITPGNWTDSCHLNADGELEKARYLLPAVQRLMSLK